MIPILSFTAGSNADDLLSVKRTTLQTYENLDKLCRALRQYQDTEITTADGKRLFVLGYNLRNAAPSKAMFAATAQSATTARVNAGKVLITQWPNPSGSTMPSPTKADFPFPVEETVLTIVPGQFLYVKLTRTEKEFITIEDLPSAGAVSFAGGTVTGGLGGTGGAGGYGGGGGGGGQGGGGGGGGGPSGDGAAGSNGDAGDDASGSTGALGGDATGAGISGDTGGGGAGSEEVNYGGNGGQGGVGGNGAAGSAGGSPPAAGATNGPTSVTIPAFTAYSKQQVATSVWEVTAAEIVCQEETESTLETSYVPVAEITGTPTAPVIEQWHTGLITATHAFKSNVTA